MTLTDSHCHLDHEKFAADLDGVLTRAAVAGVTQRLNNSSVSVSRR
jgi:Tat protein secretion system quality control protein TatD with DNase activity